MLSERFRPKTWDDFVGQSAIDAIREACGDSWLFDGCGERWLFESDGIAGCGKTSAAYVTARALGCDDFSIERIDSRCVLVADFRALESRRLTYGWGGKAIDTTSAAGRFMLVVLPWAAEMERNLTRERTRSAMAVKRGNGHRIGTVPFGYDLADDGATLVPNDAEQTAIAEICSQRSAGRTLERIAAAPTDRGVPTQTGKSDGWTHQAVARIVRRNVTA